MNKEIGFKLDKGFRISSFYYRELYLTLITDLNTNISFGSKVTSVRNLRTRLIHPTVITAFKIQLIYFYFVLVTCLT